MRISLDIMGGDNAPHSNILGAEMFINATPDSNTKIIFVGPESIIKDICQIKSKKIKIIIAGLEKDYLNQPFGIMKDIIEMSDSVIRLKAKCNKCGGNATCSHRKNTNHTEQFLIGNENFYEALCKPCFNNIL